MNADVGGFGAGSKALLGHRLIDVRHESGDGVSRFVQDVLTVGLTIGL